MVDLIIISFIIKTCITMLPDDLMIHLISHSFDVRASSIKIRGAKILNSIDQIMTKSSSINILK